MKVKAKASLNMVSSQLDVDLEDAMDAAGAGKYQVFHCALMVTLLTTSLVEIIGYAFVLPAGACDLDMPENLRGLITSIPNIGIILTAPFWGRAADTYGRKPVLLISSGACGVISMVAAFMPNLIGFGICKLIGALFLSGPSSIPFAYAGEMAPRKRRDIAVLCCNGLLSVFAVFSPLLAWAVLPIDWQSLLGSSFKPWRVLTVVYSLPLVLTTIWATQCKESPKFLMSKGKTDEALEVLRHVYSFNFGLAKDKYPVMSLKSTEESETSDIGESDSALALLKPPHLKWFALTSFLMFGLYTSLNGLFLFATDTLNKVLEGDTGEEKGTVCVLLNQPENETIAHECIDTISQNTFVIMSSTTVVSGLIVLAASVAPLAKKTLLVGMFLITGSACLLAGLVTNMVVAGMALSSLQMTAVGIGALTAYAVQLFPTTLRGTAIGAILMFGRVGSVAGANLAGYLLVAACMATFYGFGGFLYLCSALSFLLPKARKSEDGALAH